MSSEMYLKKNDFSWNEKKKKINLVKVKTALKEGTSNVGLFSNSF